VLNLYIYRNEISAIHNVKDEGQHPA